MKTAFFVMSAALLGVVATGTARADATPPPAPTAAEAPFVQKATTDIEKLYPTAAAAEKAGYLRYTDEDDTGAVSYANKEWTSADADHPSQLWYDVKGRLLGVDYSVPLTADKPHLFGIDPARWQAFPAHVHYGLAGPNGTTIYGATGGPKFKAAGGSISAPTAAQLVAAKIAKSPSDVRFVFPFPGIWDLEFWILPNPSGAFADKNPNVHPAAPPKPMSM
jgi:hypothetical protein